VAATPDSVKKILGLGVEVLIESDAGAEAFFPNSEYEAVGAKVGSIDDAFGSDIVLKVACPTLEEAARVGKGRLLISLMDIFGDGPKVFDAIAAAGGSAIGLELIPRITRAQAMDVLSSQANLAGYKAAVEAAHHFGKLFPMMMTAAGSTPQAKAVILGAGVAGLQAIATARRLGAAVEAFDVRPEVREEIQSLGARFLDIKLEESGAGEGGYARELSKSTQERLLDALTRELPKRDIIISTAQIPGRPAPLLVTEEALKAMKPGSVIVDLAAGSGGNCALSKPDEVVIAHGVTIVGYTNLPARMPHHASMFFARNHLNLLNLLIPKSEEGATLNLDLEDEILTAAVAVHAGQVRWSPTPKAPATEKVGG
jgi:NAD(P) transhydrogenase subunit alpha